MLIEQGFKFFQRVWSSPTLMTWGSFLVRSLSLVLVLPLVLNRLDTADIALWYLFSSIIGLQMMVDAGFSPTFSRVIAFAMGGLAAEELKDLREVKNTVEQNQPNWSTIERICSTMWIIYSRLTVLAFVLLSILGTWALAKPIALSSDPKSSWLAWCIVLGTSTFTLLGNVYNSYLQGINQIALLRRWEIITSLGAIVTSLLALVLNAGLLGLVAANQIWVVVNILRNRWLSRYVEGGKFKSLARTAKDKIVIGAVWPSAWRSGVGVFMTYGLIQLSGIVYAQFGYSSAVASYLLGLKLIQVVRQFSQAPFYSKLPLLAQLRATGNQKGQIEIAQKSMTLSYWVYIIGFILLGLLARPLLTLVGSNADFPDNILWCLLGLAFFAERYGAMHIQLYSTTNHIIWHTVTGISGTIYIILSLFLVKKIGVYGFPTALLLSYLACYCWHGAKYSYGMFNLSFIEFEKKAVFIPTITILFASLLMLA